ncbi:hypothetical protein EVJ58_g10453 [Rhodofomes roseus]|uniref:Uncharacterized protein n=1 Tax=Rhodofomes roseus TaxID=34475 RepID=A0A4Y9XMW7_9APHY|nr:hypothetical protein EVJ58_g10453 [Rhodofomes roseus]
MSISGSTSRTTLPHWAKIAQSIKTVTKPRRPKPILSSDYDDDEMKAYMKAHRIRHDRTVAVFHRMEDHYTSAIAAYDSLITAHANEGGPPIKFRKHSPGWKRQCLLEKTLERLRDAGVTYDPSRGDPRPGSLPPATMSDAREARLHWLELQPERRTEMYFTKYQMSWEKKILTGQLLALKKAEELSWRGMRCLFRNRVSAAQRRGLATLRCVVWLNRMPYVVAQKQQRSGSVKRRRAWRRVGKMIIWLQNATANAETGAETEAQTSYDSSIQA